jgi:hypothetical protein
VVSGASHATRPVVNRKAAKVGMRALVGFSMQATVSKVCSPVPLTKGCTVALLRRRRTACARRAI